MQTCRKPFKMMMMISELKECDSGCFPLAWNALGGDQTRLG